IAALQPDYLGFIFYNKSPRFFEGEIPEIPNNIKKVGVFVNATIEEITSKIEQYNLQTIQLHGEESPEFCNNLRHTELVSASHEPLSLEIIKVFSIKDDFNFSILKEYEDVV